jgi:hypothetical protein
MHQEGESLLLYFLDLKRLFLKKFEIFCSTNMNAQHEVKALTSLFREIIYVKSLLDKEGL